jgi:hypothetical protein
MNAATLPRIVRFIETTDCGPGATCPHCGATGRWIVRFVTDDGRHLGAMRGCVQLFPVSQVAREGLRLRDKAAKYAKQGWHLNQADTRALETIEAFESGNATEQQAMSAVKSAKARNTARFRR